MWLRKIVIACLMALMLTLIALPGSAQDPQGDDKSAQWKSVQDAMGRPGKPQPDGTFKFAMPRKDMKVMAVYDKPIKAPVAMGQTVGKLVVTVPGLTPTEFPLVAANGVERLGAMGRVGAALSYMVFGSKR